MKTIIRTLTLGILLSFIGCVTLYKPNVIYSPLVKEKGDINTSGSLGILGCGFYNLEGAYAISNHTGIMLDGMYHNRKIASADSSVDKLNMLSSEVGAGYFSRFGNSKGLFQCYGGGGYGGTKERIYYDTNNPNPEVSAQYFNLFVQPGVAFTSKKFELAFDLRANYVQLFNTNAYLYEEFEWWNTDSKFVSDTTFNFTNIEPALTMKVGGEKLKGVMQIGMTIPVINADSYFEVNTGSLLIIPLFKFSIGVSYTF